MKYRLVKTIKASGYIQWNIEKKFLFWWQYIEGYFDEKKARYVLDMLRSGVPEELSIVVDDPEKKLTTPEPGITPKSDENHIAEK